MKKILLLIFVFPLYLNAQQKQIKKIENLYNTGQYETCINKNEEYIKKFKDPQLYYYQSFAYFQLFKADSNQTVKKNFFNSSMIYLGFAIQRDRTNEYKSKFKDILNEIHDTLLSTGKKLYSTNADQSGYCFKKLASLFKDTTDEYRELFIPKTPADMQELAFSNYQGKINQKDQQGRRQGLWIEKYPNGVVKYEIQFKDGHPAGIYRKYYENGKPMAKMFFDNTGVRCAAILYNEQGERKAMGYFYNHQKDSLWQYFYNDSIVISEVKYNKGIKNGAERVYNIYDYPNFIMERFWKNGKLDSTYTILYPNGQPKFIAHYKNNLRQGDYAAFDDTGRAVAMGKYENDLKVGEWKYWNEKNKKYVKIKYINGLPENYDQMTDEETKILKQWEKNKGKYEEPDVEVQENYGNY